MPPRGGCTLGCPPPTNVHDVTQAHALLHGDERDAFGDAGFQGVEKREENLGKTVRWHVALRPGKRKLLPDTPAGRIAEKIEQCKARIRAKVEPPFHDLKNRFGLKKVRYRGLPKNTASLFASLPWPTCASPSAVFWRWTAKVRLECGK